MLVKGATDIKHIFLKSWGMSVSCAELKELQDVEWWIFPNYIFNPLTVGNIWMHRAHFLSLTQSKLRLCPANHRAGYFSNLTCDWLSIVWAYWVRDRKQALVLVSIVSADAPVLIHPVTSIHKTDSIPIVIHHFYIKWVTLEKCLGPKIRSEEKKWFSPLTGFGLVIPYGSRGLNQHWC